LNLRSAPVCSILRVYLGALVINLALVGEGEHAGFVFPCEAFSRTAIIAVLPLLIDNSPIGMDLSGAPESPIHRVGLRAGVVSDSFEGEGEDTPLSLDSPAVLVCRTLTSLYTVRPLAIGVCYQAQEENGDQLLRRNHGRYQCSLSAAPLLTVLNINNKKSGNINQFMRESYTDTQKGESQSCMERQAGGVSSLSHITTNHHINVYVHC